MNVTRVVDELMLRLCRKSYNDLSVSVNNLVYNP